MLPLYKGEATTTEIEQCKNEIIDFSRVSCDIH
jgi:hypothetical protein